MIEKLNIGLGPKEVVTGDYVYITSLLARSTQTEKLALAENTADNLFKNPGYLWELGESAKDDSMQKACEMSWPGHIEYIQEGFDRGLIIVLAAYEQFRLLRDSSWYKADGSIKKYEIPSPINRPSIQQRPIITENIDFNDLLFSFTSMLRGQREDIHKIDDLELGLKDGRNFALWALAQRNTELRVAFEKEDLDTGLQALTAKSIPH